MDIVNVCVPGHLDPYDSYGLIGCQLVRHLSRLGMYVNPLALGNHQVSTQPPDVAELTGQPIRPAFGGVFLGYPISFERHGMAWLKSPRIAVTMFESSRIPLGWADVLNGMDAVVVPSTFCRDVFQECGVTTKIHVVPLGIGDAYRYQSRPVDRPLTFLAFLDRGRRKGGQVVLQAFQRVFGDDTNYRLVLKSRNPKVKVNLLNPNIDLIQQDMTEDELYQLYLDCDVLVSPNRGEGFGLIPREFAATGGISFVTAWGGTLDDLNLWGFPLSYDLVPADWTDIRNLRDQDLGEWAEPHLDSVMAAMKAVAANRNAFLQGGEQRAKLTHRLYSWDHFGERVQWIWKGVTIGRTDRLPAIAG